MTITMQPTELPFTIGSNVWVNHNISGMGDGKPYHQGKITAIEISEFSFFKNNRRVTVDKPEHQISLVKIICQVSLYPELSEQQEYEYWLIGPNSYIFLTEEDLLAYRQADRS